MAVSIQIAEKILSTYAVVPEDERVEDQSSRLRRSATFFFSFYKGN